LALTLRMPSASKFGPGRSKYSRRGRPRQISRGGPLQHVPPRPLRRTPRLVPYLPHRPDGLAQL